MKNLGKYVGVPAYSGENFGLHAGDTTLCPSGTMPAPCEGEKAHMAFLSPCCPYKYCLI